MKLVLLPYTAISPPRLSAADTLPPEEKSGVVVDQYIQANYACGGSFEELGLVDKLNASKIECFQPLSRSHIQQMEVFASVNNTKTPNASGWVIAGRLTVNLGFSHCKERRGNSRVID